MKKPVKLIQAVVLVLAMILTIAACGADEPHASEPTPEPVVETTPEPTPEPTSEPEPEPTPEPTPEPEEISSVDLDTISYAWDDFWRFAVEDFTDCWARFVDASCDFDRTQAELNEYLARSVKTFEGVVERLDRVIELLTAAIADGADVSADIMEDWQEQLRLYEEWTDEYNEFLEGYNANPNPISRAKFDEMHKAFQATFAKLDYIIYPVNSTLDNMKLTYDNLQMFTYEPHPPL